MPATVIIADVVGRVRADRQRPQELQATGLLLAAGEAADHQQAHQRDDDEPERADLERDLAAERVEPLGGPVERDRGGVALRRLRRLQEIGRGRVEALDARDRRPRRARTIAAIQITIRTRSRRRANRVSGRGAGELGRRRGHADGRRRAASALPFVGQLVAVVAEEQLLQRRRMAHQAARRPSSLKPAHRVVEMLACRRRSARWVPSISRPWTPARSRERVGRAARSRAVIDVRVMRRSSSSVPALLGRPGTDDAHPVAQRLDLGEDVARQQHRAPFGLDLADAVLEHRLHQRVEARRRLVEDQQLGVGRQRRDQADLLAVALRVRAGLLGRVELEALEQLVAAPESRSPRSRPNRSMTSPPLSFGHRLISPRHVREPTVQRDRVVPRIAPEQLDRPCVGAVEPEEDADGRWSCRRRSARGTRGPRRSRPRDPGRRGRGSGRTSSPARRRRSQGGSRPSHA